MYVERSEEEIAVAIRDYLEGSEPSELILVGREWHSALSVAESIRAMGQTGRSFVSMARDYAKRQNCDPVELFQDSVRA